MCSSDLIKIEYTGLRPGEKLYEELMTAQENVVPTDHQKIMVLNSRKINMNGLSQKLENLKDESKNRSHDTIRALLKEIIPEYDLNPPKV